MRTVKAGYWIEFDRRGAEIFGSEGYFSAPQPNAEQGYAAIFAHPPEINSIKIVEHRRQRTVYLPNNLGS
jgi:hypothetical protein